MPSPSSKKIKTTIKGNNEKINKPKDDLNFKKTIVKKNNNVGKDNLDPAIRSELDDIFWI